MHFYKIMNNTDTCENEVLIFWHCHSHRSESKHIRRGNNSYKKVEMFKYLGSLVTNQNSIQGEIKYRFKAGISCYYSVQTLLSPWLNLKIKIYKTIIFPVVLNGC